MRSEIHPLRRAVGASGTSKGEIIVGSLGAIIIEGTEGRCDGATVGAVLSMRTDETCGDTGLAGGGTVGSCRAGGGRGTSAGAVSSLTAGDEGEGRGGGAGSRTGITWGVGGRERERGEVIR